MSRLTLRRLTYSNNICPRCGKQVEQRQRKYCSRACATASIRRPGQKCKVCGILFHHSDNRRQCCSRQCGWELEHLRRAKACDKCGMEFRPKKYSTCEACRSKKQDKCCLDCGTTLTSRFRKRCRDCTRISRLQEGRAWYKKNATKHGTISKPCSLKCFWCGANFKGRKSTYQLSKQTRFYCSKECIRTACHTARKVKIERGGSRRAPPSISDVGHRSKWTCHICLMHCYNLKRTQIHFGDPLLLLYPTIDHIVPLVKGGASERHNLALAHFICNSIKGARDINKKVRAKCANRVLAILRDSEHYSV